MIHTITLQDQIIHPIDEFTHFKTMNKNNDNDTYSNNSLMTQFWKDFCSWVRGHENLYQCLLNIKTFILDNRTIIECCLLFLYYRSICDMRTNY
jgi:hypothetical protein